MKKFTLLFLTLFTVLSAYSQVLNESFDGMSFPPTGWQNIQVSGSGLWNRVTAGTDPACSPHSGVSMAHYNSYNFLSGANALLVSPALTFTGTSPHVLSFWKYGDSGWFIYNDSLGVYYNATASLIGATHLTTIPRYNTEDGWYKHSYLLPAGLTGTYYIIFRGYSDYGNNMFLDDVTLGVPHTDDVSVMEINNPVFLTSASATIPAATIKNTGINSQPSFDVTFEFYDYSGTQVYTNTKTITNLGSWTDTQVNFDPFTLPNAEAIYNAKVYTSLTGDLEHLNDTLKKTFYTYTHDKQKVLLEVGTGTWCQYCPGAAMGADDLVTNGQQVAVVENHNGDTYAYTSSDARNTYYSLTGYPTAIFDGIKKLTGGDHTNSLYTSYLPIYEGRYAVKTAFGLTVLGSMTSNNINLNITVERYGETPFANSNLVLHVALTQSHIMVAWQGQTHLEYVSRIMVPDAGGTPLNLSTATSQTVPLTFNFNTAWGGSVAGHDFEVVTWVQDLTTKEVVDAANYDLATMVVGINEPMNSLAAGVSPNPAASSTTIRFTLNEPSATTIEITDVTGKVVKSKFMTLLGSGSHSIEWDITGDNGQLVDNGLYLCRIQAGNQVSTFKILVAR
ncbi:MAG: choice-of-anchor J domain-containing protein [Bacteroidetes bacterium]|nr:choice-of-anchor J domain-containing protein [Bacteroidota bacterium]